MRGRFAPPRRFRLNAPRQSSSRHDIAGMTRSLTPDFAVRAVRDELESLSPSEGEGLWPNNSAADCSDYLNGSAVGAFIWMAGEAPRRRKPSACDRSEGTMNVPPRILDSRTACRPAACDAGAWATQGGGRTDAKASIFSEGTQSWSAVPMPSPLMSLAPWRLAEACELLGEPRKGPFLAKFGCER